jgi:hypothetical protein
MDTLIQDFGIQVVLGAALVGRNCFIAPLRPNPESQLEFEGQLAQ